LGEASIEDLILETFVNLCTTSSKDLFSDEVMKYEQTCSVGQGELSLWKWVCDQSQLLMRSQTDHRKLVRIVKIVERLTATEAANTDILLSMGLHEYITGLLQWNNSPPEEAQLCVEANIFSLELDTLLNSIVTNLVHCGVQGPNNYGNRLIDGGCQWILDRFATRLVHSDPKVRLEALRMMIALLQTQREHRKVFLIQNYDVIKTCIRLLREERIPRLVLRELELVFQAIILQPEGINTLDLRLIK